MSLMEREIFEDTIRFAVSIGSDLRSDLAVQGYKNDTAPNEGAYASITMLSQSVSGLNPHTQYVGDAISATVDMVVAETRFDVQWYRDNAIDRAIMFRDWLRSETGITWCATANVDGRIRSFSVGDGGAGYDPVQETMVDVVHGSADEPDAPTAKGKVIISSDGRVSRVDIKQHGSGYRDMPYPAKTEVVGHEGEFYPYFSFTPQQNPPTTIADIRANGFGFKVKGLDRINILRMDEYFEGSGYEERAHISLDICHYYIHTDTKSGRVEYLSGDVDGNLIDNYEVDVI